MLTLPTTACSCIANARSDLSDPAWVQTHITRAVHIEIPELSFQGFYSFIYFSSFPRFAQLSLRRISSATIKTCFANTGPRRCKFMLNCESKGKQGRSCKWASCAGDLTLKCPGRETRRANMFSWRCMIESEEVILTPGGSLSSSVSRHLISPRSFGPNLRGWN